LTGHKKINLSSNKVNRSLGGDIFVFSMLIVVAAFMVVPMIYIINNAFKPLNEFFIYPPKMFVRNPTLENFGDLFYIISNSWVPFTRYFFNTLFITVAGTVGHVFFASLAAYAISKIRFPGHKLVFSVIVLSLMFSATVTAIPNYLIISKLGFLDSYAAVILPAFQASLGIYLIKQFMDQIPESLLEVARIDGANEFTVYLRIAMPAVKPAWLTVSILSVQALWNTTGGNFIYSEQLKPITVAMSQIVLGGVARAGVGAAVSLLLLSVPVTIFILAQSNIIETMTTSGMKD
jgi:ABC-type glycerol-3-phosphate transport system permease component